MVVNVSIQVKNTDSIEPFFILVAKGFTPTQMDILFLIKQQLARIGINLDVIKVDMPDGDTTKIRDYDLTIIEFQDYMIDDPFFSDFYRENRSYNLFGYHTSMDWDEELRTGKNEWFIDNGLQMISNNSQEKITHCWQWQDYLLDNILPCLPLFTKSENKSTFQVLAFNLREIRPVIGSKASCPGNINKTVGLAVRKAIAYAVNREEIRRVVLGDEYEITHHPTNPAMSEWLNPSSIQYCYNLRAAKGFLQSAGFDMGWYPCVNYPTPDYSYSRPWLNWESYCSNETIAETSVNSGISIIVISNFIPVFLIFTRVRNRKKTS